MRLCSEDALYMQSAVQPALSLAVYSIAPVTYPTSKPHQVAASCFKLGVLVHSY